MNRIAVTGSRNMRNTDFVWAMLDSLVDPHREHLVLGDAAGVDAIALEWARDRGASHERHLADWDTYGLAAGPIRNGEMLKRADMLIAFTYGSGKGTSNCIAQAEARGISVTRV